MIARIFFAALPTLVLLACILQAVYSMDVPQ